MAGGQAAEAKEVEMVEDWDAESEQTQSVASIYYTLSIPESQISIVNTKDKLQLCLERITKVMCIVLWQTAFLLIVLCQCRELHALFLLLHSIWLFL